MDKLEQLRQLGLIGPGNRTVNPGNWERPGVVPNWERPQWVYNGQAMTLAQFAQAVFGDTAEATHFVLKHSK